MELNLIYHDPNYKTKIEPFFEEYIVSNYKNYDINFCKDYVEIPKNIKIIDIFETYGYRNLKKITFEGNKKEKKHDMKIWKFFNIKNEYPISNSDGSIDWKIKWPIKSNGSYINVNGRILYFIEKYNSKKDDYDINCYYIDIIEKKVKTITINRNILRKTLEDHYDEESVNEYFTFFNY